MIALFIGRFQPFHKGHLEVVKRFSGEFDKIIIGIGSSQYSNTRENPFTADERKEMIERSLRGEGIDNFEIYFIPDIHDYSRWVEHVRSIVPRFDVVLARNPITLKLFKEKGFKVIRVPLFHGKNCKGRQIRKAMVFGGDWKSFLPKEVVRVIEEVKGVDRLRKLYME